jgi:cytochrome c
MNPRRSLPASGLILLGIALAPAARAQFSPPAPAAPPGPDTLFRNQCGTCHVLSAKEEPRQGPPLGGVVGRKAGWLTNPQAVIPGAVMVYRQANPATRHTIIDWLKEQH